MLEIERKFLVHDLSILEQASRKRYLVQAYLSVDPARTVRIRRADDCAFITIKGASSPDGMSRLEWEKEISVAEANDLIALALYPPIQKWRYDIPWGPLTFEIDVFEGANQGLILAEVELPSADFPLSLPETLGTEVTQDPRYYNAWLSQHPFSAW